MPSPETAPRRVISIRRPTPVDIPALIARLRHMGQSLDSIALALGVSAHQVRHWAYGKSSPTFEDGRALLELAARVEEIYRGTKT